MRRAKYPTDLTDAQWKLVRPLIPKPKPGGRPQSVDRREILNAVFYYNGKKDHHKRVTTERPHPTGGSCPREGHGKGKLIRILFSVYFGGFRG